MILPIQNGVITAEFYDPRPISNPGAHIHGAVDISRGDGLVRSPVDGIARAYVIIRPKDWQWPKNEKPLIMQIAVKDYWYDIYGGIITIEENNTGHFHIMTHFYANELIKRFGKPNFIESISNERWVGMILNTDGFYKVNKGDVLCPIGNAGVSTGPHLHWEIHHSSKQLDAYAKRIEPHQYIV